MGVYGIRSDSWISIRVCVCGSIHESGWIKGDLVLLLKHSLVSPFTVVHIMTQKYVDGLPLARQEKIWEREGISLRRTTMANWVIQCSEVWLKPLYKHMKELPEFRDCTKAYHNWFQEIINSMNVPWTNGFIESCNNKTKVLKRACCGMPNFCNFCNRILYCNT